MPSIPASPYTRPEVQAAYAAYSAASQEAERLAEAGGDAARDAEHRLYLADRAHHETWLAARKEIEPGLYRDHPGLDARDLNDWRDRYPDLDIKATPFDLGLTKNPAATWDDPDLSPEAG